MNRKLMILIFISLCGLVFSQSIDIELNNSYISVGEWTTFSVIATGDIKSIKYTEPKDIVITQTGKSTSMSIMNGKKTSSYNLSYRVRALKPGTLKLPIFYSTTSKGDKIESEELLLYVEEEQNTINEDTNVNGTFETPYAKLFIELPARNIYVGEAIPVTIVAFFSTKYQPGIERSPYIKSGSFLIDTGEKYSNNRPEKVIDGERWIQIVWNSHLTPLKSGELELEIVMDSYIEIPTSNSGFFSSSNREEIKTSTELQTIKISSLPIKNRPESFSGAIGEFSINDNLNISEANIGDPLTLTMDIYGEGNFQRITVPKPDVNDEKWKLYPESSSYQGSNRSNYQGVKSFQQILSPKSENIKLLPVFKFSYFNPISKEYMELQTSKYPLKISPDEVINRQNIKIKSDNFKELKEEIRHKKDRKVNSSENMKSKPLFWISISVFLISIILHITLYIITFSRKKNQNKIEKRQKKILIEIVKNEADQNYTSALNNYRELIKVTIAHLNNSNPEAITSEDMENEKIKHFMSKLDEFKYTGKSVSIEEYKEFTKDIQKELKC